MNVESRWGVWHAAGLGMGRGWTWALSTALLRVEFDQPDHPMQQALPSVLRLVGKLPQSQGHKVKAGVVGGSREYRLLSADRTVWTTNSACISEYLNRKDADDGNLKCCKCWDGPWDNVIQFNISDWRSVLTKGLDSKHWLWFSSHLPSVSRIFCFHSVNVPSVKFFPTLPSVSLWPDAARPVYFQHVLAVSNFQQFEFSNANG